MNIETIIDKEYPKIDENEPISKVIPKLIDKDGVILLKDGKYSGVLNKRDISRAKINPNTKAKTFLQHVAKITAKETIQNTAGLMLESDSYILPVFRKDKLIGTVTASDLLHLAAKDEFGEGDIDQFISQPVIKIASDEPVSKAIRIFNEEDISRLPVHDNEKLQGIITIDHTLSTFIHPEHRQGGSGQYEDTSKYGAYMADKKEYLDLPVKGLMSEHVTMMKPTETVRSIVNTMFKRNYRGVLIGSNNSINNIEGIVTKRDLLEPLAISSIREPMVIQFSGKLDKINGFDKQWTKEVIHSKFAKYLDFLDNAYIYVRLKRHTEQSKGKHIIFCNMRLSSPRGMFVARDEGWGYIDSINKAAEAIERQLKKQKRW